MNDDEYNVDKMTISASDGGEEKRSIQAMGICVVLDEVTTKSQIEDLLLAIKQFKGVLTADWIDDSFEEHSNRIRMKRDFKEEIRKGMEF